MDKENNLLIIPCCVYIFRAFSLTPLETQTAFETIIDGWDMEFGGIYHRFTHEKDTIIIFYDIGVMKLDSLLDENKPRDLEFYNERIENYIKDNYYRFDTTVYKKFNFVTSVEFLALVSYVKTQEVGIEFRVFETTVEEIFDIRKKEERIKDEDKIMKALDDIKGLDITYNKTLETLITGQLSMTVDREYITDILLCVKTDGNHSITFIERVIEEIKLSEPYLKRGIYTHGSVKTALAKVFLEFMTIPVSGEREAERKEKDE